MEKVNIDGKFYALKKSSVTSNLSPIHISASMSGKMLGIPSISTSCLCNPICEERRKVKGSICQKCFAASTVKRYSALNKALEENYHLLNDHIISDDMIPIFRNVAIVRIESFGDLASRRQAVNYLKIILKNPDVRFAWWTKNYAFFRDALTVLGIDKPSNMTLVVSSPMINETLKLEDYPLADHVFTVYDKPYISENNVDINCGARDCFGCQRCYHNDTETYVSEQLK